MKTGTSALAKGLTELQRKGSLPDGLLFPVDEMWPFDHAHSEVVKHHELRSLIGDSRRDGDHSSSAVMASLREISNAHLLHSRPQPRSQEVCFFVWEGLVSRVSARPERLVQLTSVLGTFFDDVSVVVGIRRQDEAMRSLYAHRLRGKDSELSRLSMEAFVSSRRFQSNYDYWSVYESFRAVGLEGSFKPLLFAESDIGTSKYLQRLFSLNGLGAVDVSQISLDGRLIHPSLSGAALRAIYSIRRFGAFLPPGFGVRELTDSAWKTLRRVELQRLDRLAMREPRRALSRRFRIDAQLSERILDIYAESNARLLEAFPSLGGDSWLEQASSAGGKGAI